MGYTHQFTFSNLNIMQTSKPHRKVCVEQSS